MPKNYDSARLFENRSEIYFTIIVLVFRSIEERNRFQSISRDFAWHENVVRHSVEHGGGTGTGSDPIPLYPRNWFVIDDVEYRGRKCLEETIEDSLCVYNGKGISKGEGFSRLKGYVTARDGSIRTLRSRYFR